MREAHLILLEKGPRRDMALVLVNGYLSEKRTEARDQARWANALRAWGWPGTIYRLWWPASHLEAVLRKVALTLRLVQVPGAGRAPLFLARSGVSLSALWVHWKKTRRTALRVGATLFPPLLCSLPEEEISLAGFSLGALVVQQALLAAPPILGGRIADAILFGGAVDADSGGRWSEAVRSLRGTLYNVYNEKDFVLRVLFRLAQWDRGDPCGIGPIRPPHPRIVNVNVTALCGRHPANHWAYPDLSAEVLRPRFDFPEECGL